MQSWGPFLNSETHRNRIYGPDDNNRFWVKTSVDFLEYLFRGGFSGWHFHPSAPPPSWSMRGVCQQRWVLFTGLFWNVLLTLLAYMYPGCRLLGWGSGNRYVPGQNVNKSGTPYDARVEGMWTHRWIISSLAKRSSVAVPAMRNTLKLMIYGEVMNTNLFLDWITMILG